MNHKKIAALIVLVCLCWPSLACPKVFEQSEVLRGLKGLKVVVENIPPDIERLGLTKRDVQNDVETRIAPGRHQDLPRFQPPVHDGSLHQHSCLESPYGQKRSGLFHQYHAL